MGIGLYCDKDSVHHDWAGHAIRVRLVLNVMRRGCHATGQGDKGMKTAFGFSEILAADNDGEAGGYYCPSIEFDSESGVLFPEAGVGINGSEFAKWENEGTCLAEMPAEIKPIMNTEQDPFDNPGHACAAGDHYHMQLDRFMVYEWDVYMTGANQNLKLNLTFESGNMSIVIKEIKFFNITNADELLVFPDPTDRSNYEFGPSSLIGKRSKSWRYYTEKGVKEFAEEVAEPAEEDGLTAETAWQISTPEDIEAMKDKVSAAAPTYFKLMNDIDMTGINHIPTVGSKNEDFGKTIYFDGNNHVISNLTSVAENEEFYYASLFGVFQGEVKNLGLVDVNLKSNLGVAGIGAYVGYGSDKGIVDGVIDNCYVTGKMESGNAYAGGLMGTTSATATITNSYAQVDVKGATFAGGLVGRGRNTVTLTDCYVSGTVAGGEGAAVSLVATSDKVDGSAKITVTNVVAVNTGSEETFHYGLGASGSVSNDIADVATWVAFNEGKLFNELPALNWQENASAGIVGDGTEANPYEIATAADLANMWTLMKEDAVTYFVQTADINMSQITEYTAPNGFNGKYNRAINYDGQNHIISNFAPATRVATENNGYYCTTLFGVMQGTVKNLGVVDAACINASLEAGILGGFGGGTWVADVPTVLDNVFVTGVVEGSECPYGPMNGGFFGNSAAPVTMTNCYAQVKVAAQAVGTAEPTVGGIFANANDLTISNSYVSATVTGTTANLVANGKVTATDVYAFGTGTAPAGVTVVAAADATAIAAIKGWAAFNEGKLFNGLPALNWQNVDASGIDEVAADVDAEAPVEYYNLQGIRVENPANGLYIRKQGSKATKVLVR